MGAAPNARVMVGVQLRSRGIHDSRVLEAMEAVPRELFVPPALVDQAYEDSALPIGFGQTISQPYIVALTCQLLELAGSERVLDVGTGSGYGAAVLGRLARSVVSIERVAALAARARTALALAGATNVVVVVGDATQEVPDGGPFDAIAVAAAAPRVPRIFLERLAPGGRLVMPVGSTSSQDLVLVERTAEGVSISRQLACRFVPLVADQS
jgi:protein-L-isoaspartate(D-aspartate) O-methyltransferase